MCVVYVYFVWGERYGALGGASQLYTATNCSTKEDITKTPLTDSVINTTPTPTDLRKLNHCGERHQ